MSNTSCNRNCELFRCHVFQFHWRTSSWKKPLTVMAGWSKTKILSLSMSIDFMWAWAPAIRQARHLFVLWVGMWCTWWQSREPEPRSRWKEPMRSLWGAMRRRDLIVFRFATSLKNGNIFPGWSTWRCFHRVWNVQGFQLSWRVAPSGATVSFTLRSKGVANPRCLINQEIASHFSTPPVI